MRVYNFLCGFALATLLLVAAAQAQTIGATEETLVIPWGQWVQAWLNALQEVLIAAFLAVATWAIGIYVPAWIRPLVMTRRTDQLLQNAVRQAIARTTGAVEGKQLEIPVANEVVRRAAQYAVKQAPDVVRWAAGNTDSFVRMLLARMMPLGVVPASYGPEAMDAAVVTTRRALKDTEGFDFGSAISRGFGR